ncbi:MAG: alpha/beta fold hydrolase [SAR202 cluster bacterium]|nr:alpha/beta fold hydrolase [SAR202 cluster bacterium]
MAANTTLRRAVYLPGNSGNREFWKPIAARLPNTYDNVFMGWPGMGTNPPDPNIRGFDDLMATVKKHMDIPVDLFGQSMGCLPALYFAIEYPQLVRRLVLAGASKGVDHKRANQWRSGALHAVGGVPEWLISAKIDLSDRLRAINIPTLLIWGSEDNVPVGEFLQATMPNARLVVIPGGGHRCPAEIPDAVAPHIAAFLTEP